MSHQLYIVDSFTDKAFAGNPAGVCLMDAAAAPAAEAAVSSAWMQGIAAEVNASETAFVVREGSAWRIRYFTPQVEVPLCGHATLASAHVMWQTRLVPADDDIAFVANVGELGASREGSWIKLNFPASISQPVDTKADWQAILGAAPIQVLYHPESGHLLELDSAETVRNLEPDLAAIVDAGLKYVIVTAASDDERYDFVSRFFAPAVGINEDPVTGVAHTGLGPFWVARTGKDKVIGYQASARGGVVQVRHHGDRVDILGQAVTIMQGSVTI